MCFFSYSSQSPMEDKILEKNVLLEELALYSTQCPITKEKSINLEKESRHFSSTTCIRSYLHNPSLHLLQTHPGRRLGMESPLLTAFRDLDLTTTEGKVFANFS